MILAAILDTLALVGLRLAPAANFGGNLTDLLTVDPADLDRRRVGSLHVDAVGNGVVDVVAIAELQLQVLALGRGAIADAVDLEHLGETLGDAGDEVLDLRALHPPRGALALRGGDRLDADRVVVDRVADEIVEQRHREGCPWAPSR